MGEEVLGERGQLTGSYPIKEESAFTSAIVSHLHVSLQGRKSSHGPLKLLLLPVSSGQF